MSAQFIDGKAQAAKLRGHVAKHVAEYVAEHGHAPGLAVVLVGEDPASQVYVRNKHTQTLEVGMESFEHRLPESTTQEALLALIAQLNADPRVHGILVQLPLPAHIAEHAVIQAIDPRKDVDGFHVVNAGLLATGQSGNVPCTPKGCMRLLASVHPDLSGLHAVVVGRSNIVGKPVAQLLLQANATVTVAHSRTKDLPALLATADIVIAALGKPEFIRGEWLKEGATVIDVGINRIALADGKTKLVGDVHVDSAMARAAFITPVPGGVGPMTIACLLSNTYRAALPIR
jgi:methylenetetrahydrofolate dehydrogenase (NADP+) / methenyltetrahydrofolate cyclohydrolase